MIEVVPSDSVISVVDESLFYCKHCFQRSCYEYPFIVKPSVIYWLSFNEVVLAIRYFQSEAFYRWPCLLQWDYVWKCCRFVVEVEDKLI